MHYVFAIKGGSLQTEFEQNKINTQVLCPGKTPKLIALPKMIKAVQALQPKIIHASPWYPNLFARIIGYFFNIPNISEVHGTAYHKWQHTFVDKMSYNLGPVHWLFVHAELKKKFIAKIVENTKIAVFSPMCSTIENGIKKDNFFFSKSLRTKTHSCLKINDAFVIGAIGRLDKVKRFEWLLVMFSQLMQTGQSYRLLIAGDGPEKRTLQNLIEKLNIQHCVTIDFYPQNKLSEFYSAIDCLVICSQSEGLPMVGLEALASGLKIVLSDNLISLQSTFLKENTLIFDCETSFLRQIQTLQKEQSPRKNRLQSKHEISNPACQYLDLYSKLSIKTI
jgi:glycosyltransferase involved in cell wall biosynthesis